MGDKYQPPQKAKLRVINFISTAKVARFSKTINRTLTPEFTSVMIPRE
jgi:hypothetical protein